jgi:clavaminate synthase/L-asparagine oxygenase
MPSLLEETIDVSRHGRLLRQLESELPRVPRRDLPGFFAAARRRAEELPQELRDALATFRREGDEAGLLHVQGMPCDPDALPPTPTTAPAPVDRELQPMEAAIALIGACLGEVTGYRRNPAGSVLFDIVRDPVSYAKAAQAPEAPLHRRTEMAYHLHQPHYLVIGCARPDHERVARLVIGSSRRALGQLSAADRRILRETPLPWRAGVVFGGEDRDLRLWLPALSGPDDDVLRYDSRLIVEDEVPAHARQSLSALARALAETATPVELDAGDVLIVDNYRTTHTRTPYVPRFDGHDRWLQRNFIRDPRRLAGAIRAAEIVPFELR